MALNTSVIVLSDSDDDCPAGPEDSVLIVECENEKNRVPEGSKSSEILDEDVTITYSQKAHVLPHARYDCTIPFCASEGGTMGPEDNNAEYCEQCFCYVCDEPASKCKFWTVPGFCHCNAHKRSVHWKSLRDKNVLGYLGELNFPFSPQDMDSDLRRAETSLQQFACSLAYQYTSYLAGFRYAIQPICPHGADGRRGDCKTCNTQNQTSVQNSYFGVMEHVFKFLDEAMGHTPKTCVVMLLGAVKLFISHRAPGNSHFAAIVSDVVLSLLWRVTSRVQTLFVNSDFPASFTKQLKQFFLALPFPPECRWLKNSLNVLPWDETLLASVLKGQNVTGKRHGKGRKSEVLLEPIVVIQARVCKLQQQNMYRELARYLKVVQSDDMATLQVMKDWVPLCLCKVGSFAGAVDALFSSSGGSLCIASRLSQPQFAAYLRILTSGHAPTPSPLQLDFNPHSGVVLKSHQDPLLSTHWMPIQGEFSMLSRLEVLKFVLRVLNCSTQVFTHPESWVKFVNLAGASTTGSDGESGVALAEPDTNFLIRTRESAENILTDLTHSSRVQIPKTFQMDYPDQALLLLATQALSSRILHSRLCPSLKVILTFKLNPWALRWLFYSLTVRAGVLDDLLCVIVEELLKEPHHPCLPKEDRLGQSFIASFLCLFFLERSVILDPNKYPARTLLANWNESHYPWQRYLRKQLEFNVALLTADKQRILHMIQ